MLRRWSGALFQDGPDQTCYYADVENFTPGTDMAKGQQRSTKEKKKPKAAHNEKKKGGPAPSASAAQAANPLGKKH
jgi:hypothetical protein